MQTRNRRSTVALNTVCPASKVHAWAAGWGYETAMNSAGVRGHTTFEHNVRTPEPVAGDVGVSSAGRWLGGACGEEASGVLAPHSTLCGGAQPHQRTSFSTGARTQHVDRLCGTEM